MSKIFDALNKTQGEVASLALPLIDGAGSAGSAPERRPNAEAAQGVAQPAMLKAQPKPIRFEEVQVRDFRRVVFHTDPTGAAADRYRLLRMRLREYWTAGKLKSFLITSALPGEGKSTTALNLATALAEERSRTVLLVDADLHRGSMTEQFGLTSHVGLAECLHRRTNPLSAVRRVDPFGWHFLSAGEMRFGTPTELLQPQELGIVFQKLSSHFDWVVVDCPPVLALSDTVALREYVDGSLIVAKAGSTSTQAVEDAIARIGRKHVVGLVLNGIEKCGEPYSSYHSRKQPEQQK